MILFLSLKLFDLSIWVSVKCIFLLLIKSNLLFHFHYSFPKATTRSLVGLDLPPSFLDQSKFSWCFIGPKNWRKLENCVKQMKLWRKFSLACNVWQGVAFMIILEVAFTDIAWTSAGMVSFFWDNSHFCQNLCSALIDMPHTIIASFVPLSSCPLPYRFPFWLIVR